MAPAADTPAVAFPGFGASITKLWRAVVRVIGRHIREAGPRQYSLLAERSRYCRVGRGDYRRAPEPRPGKATGPPPPPG